MKAHKQAQNASQLASFQGSTVRRSKTQCSQNVDQRRLLLLKAAREHQGDDPLEAWEKLVRWERETAPGGSKYLKEALHEACNTFVEDAKYKHDRRYLRLWLRYAELVKDGHAVFRFLQKQDIGQQQDLFYRAWACHLQQQNRLHDALAVLQEGLNKGIDPQPLSKMRSQLQAIVSKQGRTERREASDVSARAAKRTALSAAVAHDQAEGTPSPPSEEFEVFEDANMEEQPRANRSDRSAGKAALSQITDVSQHAPRSHVSIMDEASGSASLWDPSAPPRRSALKQPRTAPAKQPAARKHAHAAAQAVPKVAAAPDSSTMPKCPAKAETASEDASRKALSAGHAEAAAEVAADAPQGSKRGGDSLTAGKSGRARRSTRKSVAAFDFPILEDTEILQFDNEHRPVYDASKTAPLLGCCGPDDFEPDSPGDDRFASYNDTIQLSQMRGTAFAGQGDSDYDSGDEADVLDHDASKPRVRFERARAPAATNSSAEANALDDFALHEDTELLGGAQAGVNDDDAFAVRADTELLGAADRTGSFAVHEDTELLGARPTRSAARQSFAVHEDTELLGARPTAASGRQSFAVREDTELLGAPPTARGSRQSFAVREDTEVLGGRPGNRRDRQSFAVHEDTELLGARPTAATSQSFVVHEDTELLAPRPTARAGGRQSFAVHEDTELLLGARPTLGGSGDAFAVHEDTELLAPGQTRGARQSFAVHEDTELLGSHATVAATWAASRPSFAVREDTEVLLGARSTRAGSQAFDVHEDTELLGGMRPGAASDDVDASLAARADSALRMGPSLAAHEDSGEAAFEVREDTVALGGGDAAGDEFEVHEDTGLLGPAGAVPVNAAAGLRSCGRARDAGASSEGYVSGHTTDGENENMGAPEGPEARSLRPLAGSATALTVLGDNPDMVVTEADDPDDGSAGEAYVGTTTAQRSSAKRRLDFSAQPGRAGRSRPPAGLPASPLRPKRPLVPESVTTAKADWAAQRARELLAGSAASTARAATSECAAVQEDVLQLEDFAAIEDGSMDARAAQPPLGHAQGAIYCSSEEASPHKCNENAMAWPIAGRSAAMLLEAEEPQQQQPRAALAAVHDAPLNVMFPGSEPCSAATSLDVTPRKASPRGLTDAVRVPPLPHSSPRAVGHGSPSSGARDLRLRAQARGTEVPPAVLQQALESAALPPRSPIRNSGARAGPAPGARTAALPQSDEQAAAAAARDKKTALRSRDRGSEGAPARQGPSSLREKAAAEGPARPKQGLRPRVEAKGALKPSKGPSRALQQRSAGGESQNAHGVGRAEALRSKVEVVRPFEDGFCDMCVRLAGEPSDTSNAVRVADADLQSFAAALDNGIACSLPAASFRDPVRLGAGAYGCVYAATLAAHCASGAEGERVAVKLSQPGTPWEFMAQKAIHERAPPACRSLFLPARSLHWSRGRDRGSGGTVLVLPLGSHGTLLDLVNAHRVVNRHIGGQLVLYLSLQLLQALYGMQQARFIHTDIKPDNFLLSWPDSLLAPRARAPCWSAAAAASGASEWRAGCTQVIDFGRAIDLSLLPVGVEFEGMSTTEGHQCPEMLTGQTWHYCHDAFCVAATIHTLLLGEYIVVERMRSIRRHGAINRPRATVPAQIAGERKPLWDRLLAALLNCPKAPERPDVAPLIREVQEELEESELLEPRLWKEMQEAAKLQAAFLKQRAST